MLKLPSVFPFYFCGGIAQLAPVVFLLIAACPHEFQFVLSHFYFMPMFFFPNACLMTSGSEPDKEATAKLFNQLLQLCEHSPFSIIPSGSASLIEPSLMQLKMKTKLLASLPAALQLPVHSFLTLKQATLSLVPGFCHTGCLLF